MLRSSNVLDSHEFTKLHQKREIIKMLSRKMISESKLSRFFKLTLKVTFLVLVFYNIHHFTMFGHLLHLH